MTEQTDNRFSLDNRLTQDCFTLAALELSELLLMDNALLPWFILVPRVEVIELHELSPHQQWILLEEINLISHFTEQTYTTDKLNIGAIGNIVPQMHIHIVGRKTDDICWPGVVWGTQQRQAYDQTQLDEITQLLKAFLPSDTQFHKPAKKS
ncbi:MAG: HIT family protein [Candidatus Thiodiazotropha sp. (ex Cardiolucina cf. quadrata)]|nr:HIT family protein [Candidatus Thiodiazotropha sp. (ex Cardiolucina cf. quadrata)]